MTTTVGSTDIRERISGGVGRRDRKYNPASHPESGNGYQEVLGGGTGSTIRLHIQNQGTDTRRCWEEGQEVQSGFTSRIRERIPGGVGRRDRKYNLASHPESGNGYQEVLGGGTGSTIWLHIQNQETDTRRCWEEGQEVQSGFTSRIRERIPGGVGRRDRKYNLASHPESGNGYQEVLGGGTGSTIWLHIQNQGTDTRRCWEEGQ